MDMYSNSITAGEGQSLFDIALITTGSCEAAWAIAVLNGISVTEELQAGQVVNTDIDIVNKGVHFYYINKGLQPATADNSIVENVSRVFFEELSSEFN